ncbi:MAG TPA: hypothetical protein VN493_09685 [Thermoanaerobaculia bacterium]|nr:hypothetical protein [Thermoanaerobaculia bacterium]
MKRLLIAVLLFALAAAPMAASTFVAMRTPELIADSQAAVQGQVLKVHSFWSPSGRIVVTEALVRVEETIFGDAPSIVRVQTFGGNVDGFIVEADGFPKFEAGQRMVLFLSPEKDGVARVTGYQFGQFHVQRDKAGVEFAVPALDLGTNVVTKDGKPFARPQAVRLDTFKDRVRETARRSGRIEN